MQGLCVLAAGGADLVHCGGDVECFCGVDVQESIELPVDGGDAVQVSLSQLH